MTSLSYVPTPSKLIMVSQMMHTIVFNFSPQAPLDTLKNTEKQIQFLSGFQPVQYHYCPSSCACYTGPCETLSTCPKCKLTNTNLIKRHHKHIFIISPLSHDCVLWFQTHYMPKKCNTSQSTNTTLPRSQTFLMMPITVHS